MKSITNLLGKADTALIATHLVVDNKYESVQKGYLSGFGPAVINSGLLPALAFYLNDENKKKTIAAIAITLELKNDSNQALNTADDLFRYCHSKLNDRDKLNDLRNKIVDASLALKMMIRTYKCKPDNTETNE